MSKESNQLLYGFEVDLPQPILLRAGPFHMIYEKGFIRYISYGDSEILRIIYVSLRDKNWGTYPAIIENEKITSSEKSFEISYTCRNEENNETIFSWDVHLRGYETGKIIFSIKGKCIKDLMKNRAGFCVLHPVKNTAGQIITVTHPDGTKENSRFPSLIAAENPFKNIQQMEWENQSNKYLLEFKGDIFEMEDHRNWTDTSFKTFCTPLSIPFPAQLHAGDTVNQEINFSPVNELPPIGDSDSESRVRISIEPDKTTPLPLLGVAGSTEISSLSENAAKTIMQINPDFYGIDIRTADQNWIENLKGEILTAKKLQLPFFICLQLTNDYEKEFASFVNILSGQENQLRYLLIIQEKKPVTEQHVIDWCEATLPKYFPATQTGIGTYTNFTEINRNRKVLANTNFIGYAVHPQEHAFDHLSLIENLEAQADTVTSTRNIYASVEVFISSLTLRRRCNPNALDDKDRYCSNDQKSDPRQISLWAGGWALGSLKYLSESGAFAINCFQTAGRQGLCNENGELYPIGSVLKIILSLKNAAVIKTHSSAPLRCGSLLLEKNGTKHLFVANHTGNELEIELPFVIQSINTIQLFPSSTNSVQTEPVRNLKLSPYAVVCVS